MGEIIVMYSCSLCGLKRVECKVPEREEEEDIIHWFDTVLIPLLSRNHDVHSPDCHPEKLEEIMIPFMESQAEKIGQSTKEVN